LTKGARGQIFGYIREFESFLSEVTPEQYTRSHFPSASRVTVTEKLGLILERRSKGLAAVGVAAAFLMASIGVSAQTVVLISGRHLPPHQIHPAQGVSQVEVGLAGTHGSAARIQTPPPATPASAPMTAAAVTTPPPTH
jgi:hypothetical protein